MNSLVLCHRVLLRTFARRAGVGRHRSVTLRPRAIWSETLQAGERVRCERGVVWLTQSGDPEDYILRAGDDFTATRRGRIVAQALEYSWLRVASGRPEMK